MFSDVVGDVFCYFTLIVFLFPGRPNPSQVVFSAGRVANYAGKQRKSCASRATQGTIPYCVLYMTAGANKFLRIYYGKVNAFLSPKEDGEAEAEEADS
jgi:hypothetical protein